MIVFIAYSDDLCFFLPGSASPASKSKGFQGPNPFVLACVLPELPEPGGRGKLGVIQKSRYVVTFKHPYLRHVCQYCYCSFRVPPVRGLIRARVSLLLAPTVTLEILPRCIPWSESLIFNQKCPQPENTGILIRLPM